MQLLKQNFDKNILIVENIGMFKALKNTNLNLKEKVRERTLEVEAKNELLLKICHEKSKVLDVVARDLRSLISGIYSLS
ncbi:hypothetical protein [Paenibacillus psychroresistens]|uniref:hypothetical protein n=1 Tax=Paenibacillus psychroresistens TaxID=1778678 RepID=UPI001D051558|nr:hypothetical protein [Paenibacillus psychroresistens]